jgi:methylthioribose-1-phosphate isomerase
MVTQSAGPYTAAAMGMALASYEAQDLWGKKYEIFMEKAAYALSHARPTTVMRMESVTTGCMAVVRRGLAAGKTPADITEDLRLHSIRTLEENYRKADKIGELLADITPPDGTVMTQCYAETVVGTFLRACREQGNAIRIICPETRPYYQGARLTASVACDMDFDVTVITDNMPGTVLKEKKVDLFTSAADVITLDGHVINKVGTFQIALMARYWGIPYYVTGTPNPAHPSADSVEIELRDPELVLESMGQKHTMTGVRGFYPAFDVTPPELIAGVVTDRGIFAPDDLDKYFESR